MALTRDGKVFAWGCNGYGRLGDGTRRYRSTPVAVQDIEDVISISAGYYHSMALTRDGKVFAWGSNGNGQLGDRTSENRSTPVAVQDLEDMFSISAGGEHSVALTRDDNVFAWGCRKGQLRISSPQKKWGVRACHEQTFCSITHDDVEQWRAAYLISPSGTKFPYTTTAILEWLRKKNTNPASNEVIENAGEVINLLEAAVKFQG